MPTKASKSTKSSKNLKPLQKLSLWFFHRPTKTALIWLIIAVFGAASYATLLKREGFPAINTPFAIAKGSYLVNDPAKVDNDVAKPLSNFLIKQTGVKSVQTQSFGDFFIVYTQFKDKVDSAVKSKALSKQIASENVLPKNATLQLSPYEFGFTDRGDDLVVSFYSKDASANTQQLATTAVKAAAFLESKNLPLVKGVSIINPFEQALNPLTGESQLNQKSFDRYGERVGSGNQFHSSVVIGVKAQPGADNLELDSQVRGAVDSLNKQPGFESYHAVISASFAPQIHQQIDELQSSLLEGLLAVLIIGSIVIAIRASIITVLSMISVIAFVNGLLYLIGYSLNTITLFALILGLSLIVDDTIIMVEAIDKERQRTTDPDQAVSRATGKISRAMVAATSTSILSFAPLIFVGGILGSFIRAIPITIMAELFVSLLVALLFIPLFARFLLLGKNQMGEGHVKEVAAGIEAGIARFISGPMLWAKGSTKKLLLVGAVAATVGLGFVGTGGYLMQKVKFNIFPPAKDTNQLGVTITFHQDTDIVKAEAIADEVDGVITDVTGENFVRASYYGQANISSAILNIDLTDYKKRDITAPDMIKQLNAKFAAYDTATVEAASIDAGPPPAGFTVQVKSEHDRPAALKLAQSVSDFLQNQATLKRPDGSIAKIKSVEVGNSSIYTRKDGTAFVTVTAKFVEDDTSTLVTLAQKEVERQFTAQKIQSYGLAKDSITFDTGQEQENQDSFKTLAIAFPVLLLAIYLLLSFQFKSLLQPILIFTALPFSLFGITLGLVVTDNPFSFFAMLGFFALIGLSIKNTILLTDYANQARRAGMGTVDAAHEALAERFRPLIATSLTAMVSLIPLTISSPFWEGLGVVLIFGLLSSTFLVITVFPYYYLGAEFLRQHINRKTGVGWLILTIILLGGISMLAAPAAILAPFLSAAIIKVIKRLS
jgi:multidrug efflux pump subunit AcrB